LNNLPSQLQESIFSAASGRFDLHTADDTKDGERPKVLVPGASFLSSQIQACISISADQFSYFPCSYDDKILP
jgi:hypothetical protein